MDESTQFDDLTTTDETMPPPEMATMSLDDFNAGKSPTFEPIHEEEEGKMNESAFSFFGIESYLIPKG